MGRRRQKARQQARQQHKAIRVTATYLANEEVDTSYYE